MGKLTKRLFLLLTLLTHSIRLHNRALAVHRRTHTTSFSWWKLRVFVSLTALTLFLPSRCQEFRLFHTSCRPCMNACFRKRVCVSCWRTTPVQARRLWQDCS